MFQSLGKFEPLRKRSHRTNQAEEESDPGRADSLRTGGVGCRWGWGCFRRGWGGGGR